MKPGRRRERQEWWGWGLDKRQVRRHRRRARITCPTCRRRFRGRSDEGSSWLFWHVYFDHQPDEPGYAAGVRHVLNVTYGP